MAGDLSGPRAGGSDPGVHAGGRCAPRPNGPTNAAESQPKNGITEEKEIRKFEYRNPKVNKIQNGPVSDFDFGILDFVCLEFRYSYFGLT